MQTMTDLLRLAISMNSRNFYDYFMNSCHRLGNIDENWKAFVK